MNSNAFNIKNVVVLMLENRSFDHFLGDLPKVDGVTPDPKKNGRVNVLQVNGETKEYLQQSTTNFSSPLGIDPHHEFENVQRQIGSPTYDMGGFVQDAFTSALPPVLKKKNPTNDEIENALKSVMSYYKKGSLPALHSLADLSAVSDRWFSSVPGPTWPNRFFAMMGSCHQHLKMPEDDDNFFQKAKTVLVSIAAQLGKESIFSVIGEKQSKVYSDYPFPLASLLKGSDYTHGTLETFEDDVAKGELTSFSWIEPHYSKNRNSQHPPEDVRKGDDLIAHVYEVLRNNEDLWRKCLLVVLYDEHGGFYDHVTPPDTAIPPDKKAEDVTFDFRRYGVRVPAVLASPWINRGVIFSNDTRPVYDHTSLLAFVCDLFCIEGKKNLLGKRVAGANHFGLADDIWSNTPRDDWPRKLPTSHANYEVSLNSIASDALDHLNRRIISGLYALAQELKPNQNKGVVPFAMRLEGIGAEEMGKAWSKGETISDNEMRMMVNQVKSTFNVTPSE